MFSILFYIYLNVIPLLVDASSGDHSTEPSVVSSQVQPSRANVVDEDPNLDVGPLLESEAILGQEGNLVCTDEKLISGGEAKLVLWYIGNASRPFISFDSRSQTDVSSRSILESSADIPFLPDIQRFSLENEGNVLVIKTVQISDGGEYRCRIHYPKSPSINRRLLLKIAKPADEVSLLDAEERPLGSHIGPFVEGSRLQVICKVQFGCDGADIEWLLNGEPLSSKWLRKATNSAKTNIELLLKGQHAHAILTCRLSCGNSVGNRTVFEESSTTILMYYVPQVTLIVDALEADGGKHLMEKAIYVMEGQTVTFICAVKARPKPYSFKWFHNGRAIEIDTRKTIVQNTSLIMTAVKKEDTGLYTCIASNSQGDGQSNAVNIKIAHVPYCKGSQEVNLIAIRYKPITLDCQFNAQPDNISFSWSLDPPHPTMRPSTTTGPGAQTYNKRLPEAGLEAQVDSTHPPPITQIYEEDPTKSQLTIFPVNDGQGVVCMGTNDLGRTKVPCTFKLKVVDPPKKPANCKSTRNVGGTFTVDCYNTEDDSKDLEESPGISFVMSPEAKTTAHLEVWSSGVLKKNISSPKTSWTMADISGTTNPLVLKIYKSTPYARSEPVELFLNVTSGSRTTDYVNKSAISPADPNDFESENEFTVSVEMLMLGACVAAAGCLLTLLLFLLIWLRKKSTSKSHSKLSHSKSDTAGSVAGIRSFNAKGMSDDEDPNDESITKL